MSQSGLSFSFRGTSCGICTLFYSQMLWKTEVTIIILQHRSTRRVMDPATKVIELREVC